MRFTIPYIFIFIICLCSLSTFSQDSIKATPAFKPHFEQYFQVGFNLGGTSPLPMPNTIRKINGWWPEFNPSIGYELVYRFKEKWGVGAALKLDYKGMGIKSEVQYMHTIVNIQNGDQKGEFEGLFTGKNKTIVKNGYVTLPIHAIYYAGPRWKTQLGVYFGWLFHAGFSGTVSDGYIRSPDALGEKIQIDSASFEFSSVERKFDFGVGLGEEWKLNSKIGFNAILNWGLTPIFPSSFHGMDFKMYNIFATIGMTYKL